MNIVIFGETWNNNIRLIILKLSCQQYEIHMSFKPKENQIDIRTETIFNEKRNILSNNKRQLLNELRQTFPDKINQFKEKNLSHITSYNNVIVF